MGAEVRARLFGEGPQDVGREATETNEPYLGALGIIVERTLRETLSQPTVLSTASIKGVLSLGGGFKGKVKRAIAMSETECDLVILVLDRDGQIGRLRQLKDGRSEAQAGGARVACSVGLAVETLESLSTSMAPEAPPPTQRRLRSLFDPGSDIGLGYVSLAKGLDLKVLANVCKVGYGGFLADLRDSVGKH